jgi:hypothetical protein
MLGTSPPGGDGAVRLSTGPFLQKEDIDAVVAAVRRLSPVAN